jgi:hypothetical protein
MEIEHNEQKLKDITLPIFHIEQRLDKLEAMFTSFHEDSI